MERKRRMNVIHSKRKRDRVRIEVDILREQCIELKDKQASLRRENKLLEDLYEDMRSKGLVLGEDLSGRRKRLRTSN